MSTLPVVIDAYAHVGLPRFQSVADYRAVMAANGIAQAVLCSFDSCPDLHAVHQAIAPAPGRYRGLGVPLGQDRAEVEDGVRAQLAAGFSGIRLSDGDIVERGWLLDIIAEAGAIAMVCGRVASEACSQTLLTYLARNPAATVVAGHFAGGGNPELLRDGAVAALFEHPSFHIVFSRHGAFAPLAICAWAEAVVRRTGWSRVMWGSEAPVLFWRNETVATALVWVDQLGPTADERAAYFSGNARKLYFEAPARPAPLALSFNPWERARIIPSGLWANGLPVDQSLAGRLVHGWLASGGQGTLGEYLQHVLARTLPELP